MGIRMVRQPSETPNVTNIDDIIPFRYAYGDQNGYVIGKGTEVSYTIDGNTFRVNSGRVVLQGVETDIDTNGVSFTIDNASETRYFVVYYEVNLATQTTSIKLSNYDTVGYPNIDLGDDLTANSSGIARLPLYELILRNSILYATKIVSPISYNSIKPFENINEELKLIGNITIEKEFKEVATSSTGIFLMFTIWSTDAEYNNYYEGFTDKLVIYIQDGLNIVKRLSTCHASGVNLDSAIGNETYINIKYEDGKIYIRGGSYRSGASSLIPCGCFLKSIYKVDGVEYVK